MFKKDDTLTGFLAGMIIPWPFMVLFSEMVLKTYSSSFSYAMLLERHQAAPLLGLGQIANAALFFVFIKKWDADQSARGVVFSMLFYGVVILGLKIYDGSLF